MEIILDKLSVYTRTKFASWFSHWVATISKVELYVSVKFSERYFSSAETKWFDLHENQFHDLIIK